MESSENKKTGAASPPVSEQHSHILKYVRVLKQWRVLIFVVLIALLVILFWTLSNKKQTAELSPEYQDIEAQLQQLEQEANDLEASIRN